MECRVLKSGKCEITQYYNNTHQALDIVGENSTLDYITAHSDGKVVIVQDGYDNTIGKPGNPTYGNYVKLEHQNGYYTVYGHMKKGIKWKNGNQVKKGDVLGYMWDSGTAYGKHLHFEIWNKSIKIEPLTYLNKDLPNQENKKLLYSIGDIVEINGVYISSTSTNKLRPLIKVGKITKIIENTRNPYLLEDGKIGWVNDEVIINKERYLENKTYIGTSIVDALKEINVDSSYEYREELARINNVENYLGTALQNTKLLKLLKAGKLKY